MPIENVSKWKRNVNFPRLKLTLYQSQILLNFAFIFLLLQTFISICDIFETFHFHFKYSNFRDTFGKKTKTEPCKYCFLNQQVPL